MAGRPTAYREEYVRQARFLCERGATDNDLAHMFGVTVMTVWRWRARYPDFADACVVGKEQADERVARAFYQRAVGFYVETEKIFAPSVPGADPVRVKTREYYPPDVTAGQFWLKNRRPDEWRDRREVGIGGEKPGDPVRLQPVAPEMTAADHAMMQLLYGDG